MGKIRTLIVEDSLTVRKRLVEILCAHPDFEVVAEAADGKTCIDLCRELRPDVVSMDMVLPGISGLAATEYIMAYFPTPILIVSASAIRGDVYKTYDALAAGALDVLEKPHDEGIDHLWEQAFISKLKLISRIRTITHLRGRRATGLAHPASVKGHSEPDRYRLVAIGTSTGGPAAIIEILSKLPNDFPLPILLVIHIGEAFSQYLAEWIDSHSALRVSYAAEGERLPSFGQGRVIMAPPGRHLELGCGRLHLSCAPERYSCRPSVDVLFESIASDAGDRSIACLFTGMGKDGAEGLLAIRNAGGFTIAQDETSCMVFGMPQEAIRLKAAERVLSLGEIAPTLLQLSNRSLRDGEAAAKS
jgi:two-component system, chemotaxis family, protein-glutamate methylesterase/glutaminase